MRKGFVSTKSDFSVNREASSFTLNARISRHNVHKLDGQTVKGNGFFVKFSLWQGKRLYVNVWKHGKRFAAFYFSCGRCNLGLCGAFVWYLKDNNTFDFERDAQAISNLIQQAINL